MIPTEIPQYHNSIKVRMMDIITKTMRKTIHCKRFEDGICCISIKEKCLCSCAAEKIIEQFQKEFSISPQGVVQVNHVENHK
jgi:hypothetical protein